MNCSLTDLPKLHRCEATLPKTCSYLDTFLLGRLKRPKMLETCGLSYTRSRLTNMGFSGSRYVSWLPSFSVEVTHTHHPAQQLPPMQTSQLDAMVRQVQALFPHLPLTTVMEDLRLTRSIELTVDNILDGRVVVPPLYHHDTPVSPASPPRFMEDWDVSPSEG